MLRHKIGDTLFNVLGSLVDGNARGQYGMDKEGPRPTKVQLSGLSENGLRSENCAQNEKPGTGNDTIIYTRRSQKTARRKVEKTFEKKGLSKDAAKHDYKA